MILPFKQTSFKKKLSLLNLPQYLFKNLVFTKFTANHSIFLKLTLYIIYRSFYSETYSFKNLQNSINFELIPYTITTVLIY